MAIIMPIMASVVLVIIFFFFYAFYVLLVLLVISTLVSTYTIISPYAKQAFSHFREEPLSINIPIFGSVGIHNLVSLSVGVCVIVLWLVTNFWFVVNFIGVCIGITAISLLRIQSLKVSTILLVLFFIYDIFWVFLSDKIFKKNVMVSVATSMTSQSISLPMLLQFPVMLSENWTSYSVLAVPSDVLSFIFRWFMLNEHGLGQRSRLMVGMGDIVLPGIVLNFLYRFDHRHNLSTMKGFFLIGFIGYIVGVEITQVFLLILQRAEPALLFIVPCVLIPVFIAGKLRNYLKELWNGISYQNPQNQEAFELQGRNEEDYHLPKDSDSHQINLEESEIRNTEEDEEQLIVKSSEETR
eukprot:TRINITY_DN2412_c0_g1_i3.p1 TRINITY_DN2412_c0_g1~~TRINITY_DN2412_c0_g1_i3.p1  ORF type:complete len:354 (-),score=21.81 TRINITY_DN2412_c0_g1_i3:24-1085(-)